MYWYYQRAKETYSHTSPLSHTVFYPTNYRYVDLHLRRRESMAWKMMKMLYSNVLLHTDVHTYINMGHIHGNLLVEGTPTAKHTPPAFVVGMIWLARLDLAHTKILAWTQLVVIRPFCGGGAGSRDYLSQTWLTGHRLYHASQCVLFNSVL